jgi:hypothetical protein
MTKNAPHAHATKHISPEIVAAIKEAISKGQQKYSTYNGQANQGPKHISYYFPWLLELLDAEMENEHD